MRLRIPQPSLKHSPNLVVLCFFIYKTTEALLQSAIRIHLYSTVCSALVNSSAGYNFCDPAKRNETFPSNDNHSQWINIFQFDIRPPPVSSLAQANETSMVEQIKEKEIEVQKLSSMYLLAYRFLFNLPATLTCLMFGSWSNQIGRKWAMMLPCAGAICACGFFGCSLIPTISRIPEAITFILIGALFYGMCGKSNAISMGANSYITDLSTPEERTKLLGRLMGVCFFGLCIGASLLAVFYRYRGIAEVLMFAACSNAVVIIILLLFVRDSREAWELQPILNSHLATKATQTLHPDEMTVQENEQKTQCCFVQIFRNIVDSYHFLFKKRENYPRVVLFYLLGAVLFNQMTKSGEQDVILLYVTNQPFRWSAEIYGYYLTAYYGCMAVLLTLVLPLIEARFAPRDTTLILIGLSFKIVRLLTMGITKSSALMFVAAVAGSAAGFISSGTRSLVSKLVRAEDVGASFALISCMETVANLFGGSLFTTAYNYSVPVFPGAVFVSDAILHVGMLSGFIWLRYRIPNEIGRVFQKTKT